MIGSPGPRQGLPFPAKGRHARHGISRTLYPWAVLIVVASLPLAAGGRGWMMRSALLDVISLWPGWVVTVGPVLIRRRLERHRLRAVRIGPSPTVPLILVTWVMIGLALHLAGWNALPSSSARLSGSPVGDVTAASLNVRLEGDLVLGSGAANLYEVGPLRTGGDVAPGQSREAWAGPEVTISLREGPEAGWFGSGGWRISLSPSPTWDLMLDATGIEADLTTVPLGALQLVGDGRVRLGAPTGDIPIRLGGTLVLEVPSEASVEVIGSARVGPGWEVTALGKRYAGAGSERYVVEVEPGAELVVEQT